eukprot:TRINITY_DN3331_c0_g2_i1.p1 TRINITY_DN3331_c0_g2~~TRINITY_DN3331_c0_g2_i1.p1  ORF type:complete len:338 (-),score=77.46 TRINITY_DN3331_c0_g2_i1:244-1257(-)
MAAAATSRSNPYPLPSSREEDLEKEVSPMKSPKALIIEDWENATCSVCMEFPHNAILLLCSSHDKGCRPYICNTSYRYSNCLNRFKKAYSKEMSPLHGQAQVQDGPGHESVENTDFDSGSAKLEVIELPCPLCRGQVKGWTVVEAACQFLNAKKRTCMQDDCSFIGSYTELRKHVRVEHPFARPRKVDPLLKKKWRRLERERERGDVLSTITSSMPGALVLGDYVIEGGLHRHFHDSGTDDDDDDDELDAMDIGHPDLFLNVMEAVESVDNVRLSSLVRRRQRVFRAVDELGSVSHAPSIAATATSERNDESAAGDRVVAMGRSERRQNRRRSLQDL